MNLRKFCLITLPAIFLIFSFPSVSAAKTNSLSIQRILEYNRSNPILREHFRNRILEANWNFYSDWRKTFVGSGMQLENRISALIDRFTLRLINNFINLKKEYTSARNMMLPVTGFYEDQRSRSEVYRKSFEKLAVWAGDIHRDLSIVLPGIKSKKKFNPAISKGKENFQKELDFIGEQFALAERSFVNYFIQSSNTVSVFDLQNDTMIVDFYEIRVMAKALSRSLKTD